MFGNNLQIRLSVQDTDLKRQLEDIIFSTKGVTLQKLADKSKADLLIFELGKFFDRDFQVIQQLVSDGEIQEVFVVSSAVESQVLIQAIKAGIKEYLSLPLDESEVRHALEQFVARQSKAADSNDAKAGQIVHVMGTKGGVGATTVAVNLAVALAQKRKPSSVALVDMNMLFGDIPLFLELKPKYHWGEITKNIDRLDSTFLLNVLAKHPSGLHILPSPGYLNGYPAATPESIDHLLGLMQTMFDAIIVDGGQLINQATLRSIEMSDQILLISLLSLPCLSNTNKILQSFENLDLSVEQRLRLVINRYLKKNEISLEDAKDTIKQTIFWTIPNDYKTTMSAINSGKALIETAPKEVVAKSFYGLADQLLPGFKKAEKSGWSLFKRK
jgi:pilus assembly protein CpaE